MEHLEKQSFLELSPGHDVSSRHVGSGLPEFVKTVFIFFLKKYGPESIITNKGIFNKHKEYTLLAEPNLHMSRTVRCQHYFGFKIWVGNLESRLRGILI